MAVENINILCLCQHRAPVCSSIPINQSRNVTTSHSETHKMYQEKDFYIKHETTLNHTAGSILSNIIHLETTWMPWANVYFHESKQCWISLIVTEVFKIFIWKKYVQTNHRRESKCSSDSTFLDGGRARKMVRLCVYAMVIFFDFQITEPIREMLWWSTLVEKKKKNHKIKRVTFKTTADSFLDDLFTWKVGTPMLRICGSRSEKDKAFWDKKSNLPDAPDCTLLFLILQITTTNFELIPCPSHHSGSFTSVTLLILKTTLIIEQ